MALAAFLGAAGAGPASAAPSRTLTFEERVRAQEILERFYYGHQIGTTRPFEEAVPRSLIASKVRRTLRRSAALDRYWSDGLTAADLRAETERIFRATRFPGRLRELLDALDDDTFLFQECIARASLAEHRLRLNYGEGMASAPRSPRSRRGDPPPRPDTLFEAWWASVESQLDPNDVTPVAEPIALTLPAPGRDDAAEATFPGCAGDTWSAGALGGGDADGRYWHSAVWTGSLMIVWGGYGNPNTLLNTGLRYDPLTDSWSTVSTMGAPSPRFGHLAIWTGTVMVIWGSGTNAGRYDPASDTWSPVSTSGAPNPSGADYQGVWTGSRMIVWAQPTMAGQYDPVLNTWTGVTSMGAPSARSGHTAVWTGSRMVIWGGLSGSDTNTGGIYDPVANTWSPTTLTGAPAPRHGHTVVWTGSRMIVWGGATGTFQLTRLNTGGRYDPETDQWLPTTVNGAPLARNQHSAVWTGSAMIVWGGGAGFTMWGDGKRYSPASDSWTSIGFPNMLPRELHTAVWDGARMIVYGGRRIGGVALRDGGRYVLSTDTWAVLGSNVAPTVRSDASVVWTGNQMIVWGGRVAGDVTSTGAAYDPLFDRWLPIKLNGAPLPRSEHTSVWTGSKMIVWGGTDAGSNALNSGSRYDPIWDAWYPTSPGISERTQHTAVWTGSRMIIWGGVQSGTLLDSGGLYDPLADVWAATSATGAPLARTGHTAVWSGSRMIVWGGWNGSELATGAAYDPGANAWSTIDGATAPSARQAHSAVWTGQEMVVWGGESGPVPPGPFTTNTGARYDPVADAWTPTSLSNAPSARSRASAVWSGTEMVVWSEGTGGRYRPSSDTWIPMSTTGAPQIPGPGNSALVWSGDFVIVWGGAARAGSRYSIDSDIDGSANICDLDDDEDGVADALDCGPLDPLNTATHPPEVSNVMVAGVPIPHIHWDGQTGVWYDLIKSDLTDLRIIDVGQRTLGIKNATCLVNHLAANEWDDVSPGPLPGHGWLYLVRAKNASCDERAYGPPTNGVPLIPVNDCP